MAQNISSSTLSTTAPPPLPLPRLSEIATSACNEALAGVTSYEHWRCEGWNATIISTILRHLVDEAPKTFKYAVNSTIIQHIAPSSSTSSSGMKDAATMAARGGTPVTGAGKASGDPATGNMASAIEETGQHGGPVDDEGGASTGPVAGGIADERISMGAVGGSSSLGSAMARSQPPGAAPAQGGEKGRRGMHSATAGYWNLQKDGMWNFKYDAADRMGLDVVVCVLWIAVA